MLTKPKKTQISSVNSGVAGCRTHCEIRGSRDC